MEASDREDEVGDWLSEHGVGGWDLAPVLVTGALDVEWLDNSADVYPRTAVEPVVRWLAHLLDSTLLRLGSKRRDGRHGKR